MFAILTGLVLVNIFKPGIGANLNLEQKVELEAGTESLGETLINIIPDNIFTAFSNNGQMLSVIFFAMLFGFFITQVNDKPKKLLTGFFNAVFDVMMKLTMFIIKFTPIGIFGLVAEKVAQQDDLIALMQSMGLYMAVVLMALAIHAIITLPLLARFIGKVNPLKHFNAMRTPLITAFSTSSSSATLPLTIQSVEDNAGVSNKISMPLEGVGLILAVDRILDMFRTTVNVWSDSCGAAIIATSEGEELKVKV